MERTTSRGPLGNKLIGLRPNSRTVLKGGMLIDGTGGDPQPASAVVIEGERIIAVCRASELPASWDTDGTDVIDASGRVIMPGLIDCHVHLYGENTFDAYARYFNQRPGVRTIRSALVAAATLEAGFTTVRELGFGGPVFDVKVAIAEGMIVGPRILTAGWALSETGGHADWHVLPFDWVREHMPRGRFCDGPDECRRAVRRNFREGADLTKIYASSGNLTSKHDWPPMPNFTLAEIEAMVDETHKHGKRVAAHAMGDVAIRNCLQAGVDTIEHSGFIEDLSLLDTMAQQGVILVPTLSVFYWIAQEGVRLGAYPPGVERARDAQQAARRMVQEARRRGVAIALGTDTCTTYGVGQNAMEVQLLIEAGLSPGEALVAGTSTAARALGLAQDIGTVQPGKLADLLVLTRNPLEDPRCLLDPTTVERISKSSDPLASY